MQKEGTNLMKILTNLNKPGNEVSQLQHNKAKICEKINMQWHSETVAVYPINDLTHEKKFSSFDDYEQIDYY